ncbi:MAG: hypothetical protein QG653_622 [Patescibacteria group bacterium]|nr:hypothetical protein [Patescibacteria group bacterium]
MKKLFIGIILVSALASQASAATNLYIGGQELYRTSSPLETCCWWEVEYYLTINNPLTPSAPYTIGITGKNHYVDGGGINPVTGVRVAVSDVPTTQTDISLGFGDDSVVFTAPSSGTENLTMTSRPQGTCTAWGYDCTIPVTNQSWSNIPLVSASVNLDIGQWFEEKATKLLSLFNVEKVVAQTGVVATTTPKVISILVADVNLNNAQLVRVSDGEYYATFTLTSKGELQEDVTYRLSFLNQEREVEYTQTFASIITLTKNRPVFINEKVILPEGFSGTYDVRVSALTKTGLPLGSGMAGKITLEGKTVPSISSCVVNSKEYQKNETLPVTCSIVSPKPLSSYTNENGGYVVVSKAFYRSEPQPRVEAKSEITNSKSVQTLQGLSTPGNYVIRTQLMTRSGIPAGKEVVNTFVINGTSVSIMNLMLDKNFYQKDEQAKGTLVVSAFTTEKNKYFKLSASLEGKHGPCANIIERELDGKSAVELPFPITKRCLNPSFKVTITDERGNLLAEKVLAVSSSASPMSTEARALLAIIGLGILFYVVRHEKVLTLIRKEVKRGKK